MKKVISMLLAVTMMLSLFACGGTPPATVSPSSSPAASPSAAPPTVSGAPESATPSAAPAEEKQYGGTLKIITSAEGASALGVPWLVNNADSVLIPSFFEALLISTTSGEYLPGLAESYEIDAENLQLIAKLRPNVKFTDGSEFNAEVAGWNFMKFVEAHRANQHIIGYEAPDPLTLILKFDEWQNGMLSSLTGTSMVSKESYEKNGEAWAMENPVGTGPFIVKEYVPGQYLKVEKNPNYWQEGKPYLDGVEYHFIRDSMSQMIAMQSEGEQGIDVIQGNNAEMAATLRDLGFVVDSWPSGNISLVCSTTDPASPLSDLRVRQAISYAIDREAIVAARGFGIYSAAYQWAPSTNMAFLPESANLSYNPEKAKELLAEAGYPNGFSTTLYGQPGVGDKDATSAVQKMLESVGITAAVEFPDAGGYSAMRSAGWEGILVHGCYIYPNISTSLGMYFDENNVFMVGVKRTESYIDALNASLRSPQVEPELLKVLHTEVLDNLMFIPLWYMYGLLISKTNVHETTFTKLDRSNLADCWMS